MKKIYFSAMMLISVLGLQAQEYVLDALMDPIGWPVNYPGSNVFDTIDLMINQSDSNLSGTWRNDSKFAIPKNTQGDLTLFGNYLWDNVNSVWIPFVETQFSYTYNSSNQATGMVRTQGVSGYSLKSTATYTIDGSGNYTIGDYIDTITFGPNTTFKAGKDVMTYNGSGELTTRVFSESSSGTTTPLEDDTKYTFTWTGGKVTEVLEQSWDGSSAWENNVKQTLTYDGNGRMTQLLQQDWNGTAWENDEKEDYTYDAQGRIETMTDYVDTSGSWANEDRTTYVYSGGQLDEYIIERGDGTTWTNEVKYKAFYNAGDVSYALGYLWDGSAFETSAKLRVLYNDTTAVGGATPNPPSNMVASGAGRVPGISLTWDDNSVDEDGFTLERSTDGTIFTTLADLAVNTNSYLDTTGLTGGTQYFYRVSAYNAFGASAPSNVADAYTWTVSVDETPAGSVSVFPNPTSGQFNISTPIAGSFTLRNLQGATVMSGKLNHGNNVVNTEGMSHGFYLLEVSTGGEKSIQKILFN